MLRIICPNLDFILEGIDQEKLNNLKKMFISVGDFNRTPSEIHDAEVINFMFYGHGHKFIYNFKALRELLTSMGFSSVQLSSFGKSSFPAMAIERRKDESFYSLYLEAVK